jgi:hypothetical protein
MAQCSGVKNHEIWTFKVNFLCQNILIFPKTSPKGFRPPSAMKGIGYFQNLRNLLRIFLEIFWISLGIVFGNFLGGFFGRNFFGGIFWEKFFGRIFWEDFSGRIFLGEILWEELLRNNKELMFLSSFWGNFVSMQGGRILILRSATQAHRT